MYKQTVIFAVTFALLIEVAIGRSHLQFSGRSFMNKEQKEALRRVVQGKSATVTQITTNNDSSNNNNTLTIEPRESSTDVEGGDLDGEGCMKKVVMVEEVEFDTEVKCTLVYQESCFESYTTTFKNTKAEECDESFKKECEVEYNKVPTEEKVQICNEMLNRDCGAEGDIVCSKEYETVCETIYEEHTVTEDVPICSVKLVEKCKEDEFGEKWCDNVPKRECTLTKEDRTKLTPKTECRKEMAEVCGPESCPLTKGERICRDEIKTVVNEVPQESCTMVPRKMCSLVTRVVPMLEPIKHCMDIPKEVCAKSRINPVRKKRPVVRRWCNNDTINKDEGGQDGGGGGSSGGGDGSDAGSGNDMIGVAYVLSWTTSNGEDNVHYTAELINLDNGERLCSKSFPVSKQEDDRPNWANYALLTEKRDLVVCGAAWQNRNCYSMDVDTGDETLLTDNGAFDRATSLVDNDGKLIQIGGNDYYSYSVPPEDYYTYLYDAHGEVHFDDVEDVTDLDFETETLKDYFNGVEVWTNGHYGRGGCLLKVDAPEGDALFYGTSNDKADDGVFAVKWNGQTRKSSDILNVDFFQWKSVCGHAKATDGKTLVYMFGRDRENEKQFLLIFKLDTRSKEALESQMTADQELTYEIKFVEDLAVKPSLDFKELLSENIPGFTNTKPAVTLWMGDNRSLILSNGQSKTYFFDADTEEFTEGPTLVRNNDYLALATAANDVDRQNLGCSS